MHLGGRYRTPLVMLFHLQPEQVVVLAEYIALSLVVDDAGMVAAVTVGRSHDVSLYFPWTQWAVAHGIAYALGAAGGSEGQVILAVALVEPGSFLVGFQLAELHDFARIGYHVLVQLHAIQVGVAPIHIGLSVIVNEYGGVNVFPVLLLPYQRLADGVFERAVGRVGNQDSDAVSMQGTIHVELAVALHYLLCPCSVVPAAPGELLERGNGAVVSPVHHVGGSIELPVQHLEFVPLRVIFVVAGIEEDGVVVYHRRRVGRVLGLDDGHLGVRGKVCASCADSSRQQEKFDVLFHNYWCFDMILSLVFLPSGARRCPVAFCFWRSGEGQCSRSREVTEKY